MFAEISSKLFLRLKSSRTTFAHLLLYITQKRAVLINCENINYEGDEIVNRDYLKEDFSKFDQCSRLTLFRF